jgi:hypothetical protein
MKAEVERVRLKPRGAAGRWVLSIVRALPPGPGRRLARLAWRLGLFET